MNTLQQLGDRFKVVQTTLEMHGGRADGTTARACYDTVLEHRSSLARQLAQRGVRVAAPALGIGWPVAPPQILGSVTRPQVALLQALCLDIERMERQLDGLVQRAVRDEDMAA